MEFFGMVDPRLDEPLIEIVTVVGQVVDLRNESDLNLVVRRADELSFEFTAAAGYGSLDTVLRFLGVRDLHIVQPPDWHLGEASQFDDLLVRPQSHSPQIVLNAGGLVYEFNAAELQVVVEPCDLGRQGGRRDPSDHR